MLLCICIYFKEVVNSYPKLQLTQYATVKTNVVHRAATKDITCKLCRKLTKHGKFY